MSSPADVPAASPSYKATVITTDLTGTIIGFNESAEEMFGYSAAEAIGQSTLLFTPADRHAEEDFLLAQAKAGVTIDQFETVRLSKGGMQVNVSLTAYPMHDSRGEVVGAARIVHDLTERRRIEREAQRLAAIVESSDDAIVSKDLNGIIQTWNRGAERIFGYTAEEVIGKPILIILPEDRYDEETDVLQRIRAGESVEHFETIRRRKDGKLVDISLTVSPIRTRTGEVVGASKIARDVSEQKKLQRQAEEASRLKDEFLATLSHELRTPLNTVLGYTAMLKEEALSDEHRSKALGVVQRNADALRRLVDEILDASRIITGRIRLNRKPCRLDEVLREAVESVRPAADAKGVRLSLDVSEPLPVYGDSDRLRQILWNLLTNGVKFTPAGGSVSVSARMHDHRIDIAVSDTGIGIARESIPFLFQRFWQAERADAREYGGLGIGLALARHFAELHGGSISASSEGIGKGATFRVELPAYQARQTISGLGSRAVG